MADSFIKFCKPHDDKADLSYMCYYVRYVTSLPNLLRVFFFFFSFSLEISADSDYSHKIVRCLPLGRKAMTNLDSV